MASNGSTPGTTSRSTVLPCLLGHRDDAGEQFALVVGEELLVGELVLAGAGRDRPHRHHDDVVPPQVGLLEDVVQVRHAAVIAHRHQDAAGARVHGVRGDLGPHVEIEFLEARLLWRRSFCLLMISETVKMTNRATVKLTP